MTQETTPSSRWKWVRLGDVCARVDYGFTASADFSIKEPRLLRITDIQNGSVNWEMVPGCKITASEEAVNRLSDGDIVIARTGATTGKSFLIKKPPRAVFASYLISRYQNVIRHYGNQISPRLLSLMKSLCRITFCYVLTSQNSQQTFARVSFFLLSKRELLAANKHKYAWCYTSKCKCNNIEFSSTAFTF